MQPMRAMGVRIVFDPRRPHGELRLRQAGQVAEFTFLGKAASVKRHYNPAKQIFSATCRREYGERCRYCEECGDPPKEERAYPVYVFDRADPLKVFTFAWPYMYEPLDDHLEAQREAGKKLTLRDVSWRIERDERGYKPPKPINLRPVPEGVKAFDVKEALRYC